MVNQAGIFVCFTASLCLLQLVQGGVFIPILQQEQDVNPKDGSYKYSYATANGIMVVEQGHLKSAGTPEEAQAVEGLYTYLTGDGTLVNVRYFADEGGFRAVPNVIYRGVGARTADNHFQDYDTLRQSLRLR